MDGEINYSPLASNNSFRLIELQPGTALDIVSVRLVESELTLAPRYDAISYVWGDGSRKVAILCSEKPVAITENLHWALTRLRHERKPKIVWADAICINQSDNDERSSQVTLMGEIYSGAQSVFLCMGEDPDGGAQHVAALVALPAAVLEGEVPSLSEDPKQDDNPPLLHDNHPLREDVRWNHLAVLMDQPWFQRVWVVQEAGLAQDPRVLYGAVQFGFRDLMRLMYRISRQNLVAKLGISMRFIHMNWSDWAKPQTIHARDTLFDLISDAAILNCKDPRDRIYAFLGHPLARSPETRCLFITPDYSKDVGSIYHEVAAKFIKQVGIRFLSAVEHDEVTITENQASWVVRWDISLVQNEISTLTKLGGVLVEGSQGIFLDKNDTVLVAKGTMLDRLQRVYRMSFGYNRTAYPRFQETPSVSAERITIQEVIAGLNALKSNPSTAPYSSANAREHAFLQTLMAGLAAPQKLPGRRDNSWLDTEFKTKVGLVSWNRNFAVTEKGYYCLTPRIALPGDVVSVIFGAQVPFILRPCLDAAPGSAFRLLGEAYVHGVTDDILQEMLRGGTLRDQTITIC
ncbi:heterokaryon incompatibility protein-domain-containing protein [Podospora didyma]|uniref:Heterokaryon incompatibility protein-domain-containing protein n=1 Tax=Podospora didyma TaxID=330526 RepID=A0AAE0TZ21_9PEZI|nr:heterokaryon incompatibility protein-domain-containing protein [Podospora didyma]